MIGLFLVATTILVMLFVTGKLVIAEDRSSVGQNTAQTQQPEEVQQQQPIAFTEADIQTIESEIRNEFTGKGLTVQEVEMIIESPRQAVGYVKGTVRAPTGEMWSGTRLFQNVQVYFDCSATKTNRAVIAGEINMVWKCDPLQ